MDVISSEAETKSGDHVHVKVCKQNRIIYAVIMCNGLQPFSWMDLVLYHTCSKKTGSEKPSPCTWDKTVKKRRKKNNPAIFFKFLHVYWRITLYSPHDSR